MRWLGPFAGKISGVGRLRTSTFRRWRWGIKRSTFIFIVIRTESRWRRIFSDKSNLGQDSVLPLVPGLTYEPKTLGPGVRPPSVGSLTPEWDSDPIPWIRKKFSVGSSDEEGSGQEWREECTFIRTVLNLWLFKITKVRKHRRLCQTCYCCLWTKLNLSSFLRWSFGWFSFSVKDFSKGKNLSGCSINDLWSVTSGLNSVTTWDTTLLSHINSSLFPVSTLLFYWIRLNKISKNFCFILLRDFQQS